MDYLHSDWDSDIFVTKYRYKYHIRFKQGTKNANNHINGLVQDYSNYIANALKLLQYCAKPSIYIPDT